MTRSSNYLTFFGAFRTGSLHQPVFLGLDQRQARPFFHHIVHRTRKTLPSCAKDGWLSLELTSTVPALEGTTLWQEKESKDVVQECVSICYESVSAGCSETVPPKPYVFHTLNCRRGEWEPSVSFSPVCFQNIIMCYWSLWALLVILAPTKDKIIKNIFLKVYIYQSHGKITFLWTVAGNIGKGTVVRSR